MVAPEASRSIIGLQTPDALSTLEPMTHPKDLFLSDSLKRHFLDFRGGCAATAHGGRIEAATAGVGPCQYHPGAI